MPVRRCLSAVFSLCLLSCSAGPKSSPSVATVAIAPPATPSLQPPPSSSPLAPSSAVVEEGEPPQSELKQDQLVDASTDGLLGVESETVPDLTQERGFGPKAGDTASFGMVNLTKPPSTEQGSNHPLKVRFGAVSIQGGLDADVVERILRQSFGVLRGCYQTLLLREPNAQGNVVLSFEIDENGSVSQSRVLESELNDTKVNPCLVKAMTRLAFPRPSKVPVTATLPLRFSR